jgi:hypothetical protein
MLLFGSKLIYEFLLAVSCVQSPISYYGVAFCVVLVNNEDAIAITLGTHKAPYINISQFGSQRLILISDLSRTGDRKWKEPLSH